MDINKQQAITVFSKKCLLLFLFSFLLGILFCLSGCGAISGHIQGDDVCKKLEEKYGEKFGWSSIGDRWFTNHAEVTAYPVSNEELKFTAKLNFNTNEISDDYEDQKQIYVMRRDIVQQYKNAGVECRCAISKNNNPENAYFIKVYFCKESLPTARLYKKIFENSYNKYHCNYLGMIGNVYERNDYNAVCECLDKWPDGQGFDGESKKDIYHFTYRYGTDSSGKSINELTKNEKNVDSKAVIISFEDLQKDLARISNGNVK